MSWFVVCVGWLILVSTGGYFGENFFLWEMVGGGVIFCLGLLWSRVVLVYV